MAFSMKMSHPYGEVEMRQDGDDMVFAFAKDGRNCEARFSDFVALLKKVQQLGIAATPFAAGHIAGALARAAFERKVGDKIVITSANVEEMVRTYLPEIMKSAAAVKSAAAEVGVKDAKTRRKRCGAKA